MKKRFKEHVQGGGSLNFRSYRTQPQDLPQNPKWDLEPDEAEQETLESVSSKEFKQSAQSARDYVDQLRRKAGEISEVAPPGWEHAVKAMKKHQVIDDPWALAWWLRKQGAKPHKVVEALSRLKGRASAETLLREYDDMSHACSLRGSGFTEAMETEHELRKAISDAGLPDLGVHIAETGLSQETIIISIDDQDALEKEFHLLVTCHGDGLYDAHLYESTTSGSRPLNVDRDLNFEQLKLRVLEFSEAVHELIASTEMDDLGAVPSNAVDERIIQPKKPKKVNEQKAYTKRMLDNMVQARINRPVSSLKENLIKTDKILRG